MEPQHELECRKLLYKDGTFRSFDDIVVLRSRIVHSQFLSANKLSILHQWELDHLFKCAELVQCAEGEQIFQNGEAADCFYIVFTGEVQEEGAAGTSVYIPGDFFGLGEDPVPGSLVGTGDAMESRSSPRQRDAGPHHNENQAEATVFLENDSTSEESDDGPHSQKALKAPCSPREGGSSTKDKEPDGVGISSDEAPNNLPQMTRLKSDLWHVATPRSDDNGGGPFEEQSVSETKNIPHKKSEWKEIPANNEPTIPGRIAEGDEKALAPYFSSGALQEPTKSSPEEHEGGKRETTDEEQYPSFQKASPSGGLPDEASVHSLGSRPGIFSGTGAIGFPSDNDDRTIYTKQSSVSSAPPDPRLWAFRGHRTTSAAPAPGGGPCELIRFRYQDYEDAVHNTGTKEMLELIHPSLVKTHKPKGLKKEIELERSASTHERTLALGRALCGLPPAERPPGALAELAALLALRVAFLRPFTPEQQVRFLREARYGALRSNGGGGGGGGGRGAAACCIYARRAPAGAFHIVLTGSVEMRVRSKVYDETEPKVVELVDKEVPAFEVLGDAELEPGHTDGGRRAAAAWARPPLVELLSLDHAAFRTALAAARAEQLEARARLLRRTEGFNFLGLGECRAVAAHARRRERRIDEFVCTQRRKANEIIVIERGECDVHRSLSFDAQSERELDYTNIGRIGPRTALGLYILLPEKGAEAEQFWRESVKTTSTLLYYTFPRHIFYTVLDPEIRKNIKRGLQKITNSITGLWGQVPNSISPGLVEASKAWAAHRRGLLSRELLGRSQSRPLTPKQIGFGRSTDALAELPIGPVRRDLLPASSELGLQISRPNTTALGRSSRSTMGARQRSATMLTASASATGTLNPAAVLNRTTGSIESGAPGDIQGWSPAKARAWTAQGGDQWDAMGRSTKRIQQKPEDRLLLKRQDSKREWKKMMKTYDITRPMQTSEHERYVRGENIYERWCPFQVLEIKTNNTSSECFFRVLGGFKSIEAAQLSVLALYGGGSSFPRPQTPGALPPPKEILGCPWLPFQSYELLDLSQPHHTIVFCLDAPIEFVSFTPGDQAHAKIEHVVETARVWKTDTRKAQETLLAGVTFPSFSKVIAQEWSCISLKETRINSKDRQTFILDSLLNPPFFRQITLVNQIHGCFATKHHAARAAYSLKEDRKSSKKNMVIVPMYQWLPCSVEGLHQLHIDQDEIRELIEGETRQLGIDIQGHTLNGLTTRVAAKKKNVGFKNLIQKHKASIFGTADGEFHFDFAMVKKLQAREQLQRDAQERSRRRRQLRARVLASAAAAQGAEDALQGRLAALPPPRPLARPGAPGTRAAAAALAGGRGRAAAWAGLPGTAAGGGGGGGGSGARGGGDDRAAVHLRQARDLEQERVFLALGGLDYRSVLEGAEEEWEAENTSKKAATRKAKMEKKKKAMKDVPLGDKIDVLETMLKTKRQWQKTVLRARLGNERQREVEEA